MKIALMFLLLASNALHAESKNKNKMMLMEMTKEQRQTMASAHEKMASCLRSDTDLDTCRNEMMESCKNTMGEDGCKMMNKKMNHGMMKDKK